MPILLEGQSRTVNAPLPALFTTSNILEGKSV
jgi:hypothetical protein